MAGRSTEEPRTVLEQLLREQDRTYEEIVQLFEMTAFQLGEKCTITVRHLRRLARGERSGTTPVTRRVLQAMFDRRIEELLQPWTGHSARDVAPGGLAVLPPVASHGEVLATAAQRAREFALLAQTSLTGELMDQIRDDVRELAMLYSRRPVQEVLYRLVSTQEMLFSLLEARQVPWHARQLYFMAGVVSGMLARASHDLSDPYNAQTQARTAFVCADRADHDGLRAWIRGLQSMIAYWSGLPKDSVRYAQSGRTYAHNSAAVWLPAVEARAWAQLGNDARTLELVEEASRNRDQAQSDDLDELGGICTFGRSRQLYCAADALAWLPGQAEICQRVAEEAVQAYQDTSASDWSFSFQAGSHADLAIARIGGAEIEGAAEALTPVLGLPIHQRTNPIIQSVQRVHAELAKAPQSVHSRTLTEEIKAFTVSHNKALPYNSS